MGGEVRGGAAECHMALECVGWHQYGFGSQLGTGGWKAGMVVAPRQQHTPESQTQQVTHRLMKLHQNFTEVSRPVVYNIARLVMCDIHCTQLRLQSVCMDASFLYVKGFKPNLDYFFQCCCFHLHRLHQSR